MTKNKLALNEKRKKEKEKKKKNPKKLDTLSHFPTAMNSKTHMTDFAPPTDLRKKLANPTF